MKIKFSFLSGGVIILLITCFHLLLNGYEFAMGDQDIQIPLIKKILNPKLYHNDMLFSTVSGYVSYFPQIIAFLVSLFGNLKIIFFTLYFLSVAIIYSALFLIGKELINSKAAILFCSFFLFHNLVLGGSEILFSRLYPAQIATPITLLSILFYLKNRKIGSFVLLGICFNLHVLLAAYVVFFQGINLIYNFLLKREKGITLLFCLLGFIICALPSIFKIFQNLEPITNFEASIELFRIQGAHHSFPSYWSIIKLLSYFTFILIGVFAYRETKIIYNHLKIFLNFCYSILFLCFVGVIFTEIIPSVTIIKAQLFRSTSYLTIFLLLFISSYITENWKVETKSKSLLILISFLFILPMSLHTSFIAIVLYFLSSKFNNSKIVEFEKNFIIFIKSKHMLILLIAVSIFIVLGVFYFQIIVSKLLILANYKLRMLLCFIALIGIVYYLKGWEKKKEKAFNILFLGLTFLIIIPSMYSIYHSSSRYNAEWIEVQEWAKTNTKIDALFLTPPTNSGFRVFSERAVVGEWRDGTQQYFSNEFGLNWWKRINDIDSKKGVMRN